MNRPLSLASARRGLTLVEVMISLGLLSLLGAATISMFIFCMRASESYYWHGELDQEMRNSATALVRDVRQALSLENAYEEFTADDNTIILRLPAVDANRDPLDISSKFDWIVYYADGGKLMREVFPHADSNRPAMVQEVGRLIQGATYGGTFASQPNALGAEVIHYQFMAVRESHGNRKALDNRISGSVRLRNRTLS